MRSRIIGSAVVALPFTAAGAEGVVVWRHLPDQVAVHWSPDGRANGYDSPSGLAVGVGILAVAFLAAALLAILRGSPEKVPVGGGILAAFAGVVPAVWVMITVAALPSPPPAAWVVLPVGAAFGLVPPLLLRLGARYDGATEAG
ncbi:DUF1648 domain-containing protein (plasmid) [Curtobacterium sp. TC1]|nr:DUF1648 domain-containing protein [Curtobacterium sp. TC1]